MWNVHFLNVDDRLALVSLDGNGNVISWDWETRMPLSPPLRTGQEVEWLRLSADGRRLFFGSTKAPPFMVETDVTPWAERACAIADRNLTEGEWEYHMPDLPYRASCPTAAD